MELERKINNLDLNKQTQFDRDIGLLVTGYWWIKSYISDRPVSHRFMIWKNEPNFAERFVKWWRVIGY